MFVKPMRILVTCRASYIGSYMVRMLVQLCHAVVTSVLLSPFPNNPFLNGLSAVSIKI